MSRALVRNLLAVALSISLTLGLAELVLQLVDLPQHDFSPWIRLADTAYGYAPNLRTRMTRAPEYDVAFATNSLGLRDDEIGPKHGPRVLLLGDSFTSGYGVERDRTFADLIEKRLGVEVVNAGVGGYEIVHQVHYFEGRGRALDPDLVVYALYLANDLVRNDEWQSRDDGTLISLEREFPTRVARDIKLVRLAKMLRYRSRVAASRRGGEWEPFDDYLAICERRLGDAAKRHYQQSRELLARLAGSVEESGADLLVAMFSYRTAVEPQARDALNNKIHGFERRYDLDRPAREMAAILGDLEVDYVDLNTALRAAAGGEPLYFRSDGHFTQRGHQVVAGALGAAIAGRLPRSQLPVAGVGD